MSDGSASAIADGDGLATGKRQRPASFANRPLGTQTTMDNIAHESQARALRKEGEANTLALRTIAKAAKDRDLVATLSAPAIRNVPRFRDFLAQRADELIAAHVATRGAPACTEKAANDDVTDAEEAPTERGMGVRTEDGPPDAAAEKRGAAEGESGEGRREGERGKGAAAVTAAATGEAAAVACEIVSDGRLSAAAGAAAAEGSSPLPTPSPAASALLPAQGSQPSPPLPRVLWQWRPAAPPRQKPAEAPIVRGSTEPTATARVRGTTGKGSAKTASGRSAAALLSVDRRAQLTRQLRHAAAAAAQRSSKGKSFQRSALFGSASQFPAGSVPICDVDEVENGDELGEEDEFEPLIGEVKELEQDPDDDDVFL